MKKLIRRFDEMLMDTIKHQKWSSKRFTYLFTVLISNFAFWIPFIIITCTTGNFPVVDMSIVYVYGMANGFAIGGKLIQRHEETKENLAKITNGHGLPKDEEESPEDTTPPPHV